MRNPTRFTLLSLGLVAVLGAASCDEYLGNVNEGLNIHDLGGKVLIPKTLVGTSSKIGVVYVGIYSAVDTQYGFLGPVTAPDPSGGVGDAFPYGGTSVGDFYTRDAREVCQVVSDRNVKDAGANWELDFAVLQFPFYKGSIVWAFADQDNSTCNANGGFYDPIAIYIDPISVTAGTNGHYTINIQPTDLTLFIPGLGSSIKSNVIDAQQRLY
ncbi:MAG TPA: hypothetical protein VMV18_09840, partial [bacterium]|nr:hypothetical protein [bacterium]